MIPVFDRCRNDAAVIRLYTATGGERRHVFLCIACRKPTDSSSYTDLPMSRANLLLVDTMLA